ncbi:hypothetical protein AB1Y20_016578 [Prymnesium parvum]|uniref:ATP-grasp domain-containing protein n=1 Tax=Prymnesium parvum TaxID=97485 RepID=A0AB34IAA6_PRYPA
MALHTPLRFRTDQEKYVLLSNFHKRGWLRSPDESSEWNVFFASPHSVKLLFSAETRLTDAQLVSHFPNHYELTRKDLMVKNLKRYRKELERLHAERGVEPPPDFDLIPTTFLLPADLAIFIEEFKRTPSSVWIMKPTSKSQGKGIFLISRLAQVKRWASSRTAQQLGGKDAYVISRYISDPLLIGGKKFDLRIYVLVLNYRPLKVYIFKKGFARFTTINYTNDFSEMDNELVHLTNVAIQKHADGYSATHGGKWSLKNLRQYLEGTRGTAAAATLMEEIGWIIVHSLKACQNVIINDKHCFECYGFDIMIDNKLKPWLLEVNASPSLSTTTASDKMLKLQLIDEMLDLAVAQHFGDASASARPATARRRAPADAAGGAPHFELLYDEAVELEAERARRDETAGVARRKGSAPPGRWPNPPTRRGFYAPHWS